MAIDSQVSRRDFLAAAVGTTVATTAAATAGSPAPLPGSSAMAPQKSGTVQTVLGSDEYRQTRLPPVPRARLLHLRRLLALLARTHGRARSLHPDGGRKTKNRQSRRPRFFRRSHYHRPRPRHSPARRSFPQVRRTHRRRHRALGRAGPLHGRPLDRRTHRLLRPRNSGGHGRHQHQGRRHQGGQRQRPHHVLRRKTPARRGPRVQGHRNAHLDALLRPRTQRRETSRNFRTGAT